MKYELKENAMSKVILISIDGMRPDGLLSCGNNFVEELKKKSTYTFDAKTVYPPVTLPCHLSMFHSVPPERHGTLSNSYVTPVRPVNGIFEQFKASGKRCAMFYGWEEIRDVGRPGSLAAAEYINSYSFDHTDAILTDRAINYIKLASPDFVFLYMAETDDKGGHDVGWMTDTYLEYINFAIDNVKKVIETVGDEYTIVITADHGGHDRCHGFDMPEDMTIPMFFCGKEFEAGKQIDGVTILDIAPTIADVAGVLPAREWEGKSLKNK